MVNYYSQDLVTASERLTFVHQLKHDIGILAVSRRQLDPKIDEIIIGHVCNSLIKSREFEVVLCLADYAAVVSGIVVL